MPGLKEIKGYDEPVINICLDDSEGEVIELADLYIQLPKVPKSGILFDDLPKKDQRWTRIALPQELSRIRSMDEWLEMPKEFRSRYLPYIKEEFHRRNNGVWFMNNGVPTYITGRHYMMLQWSKLDIGYPYYLCLLYTSPSPRDLSTSRMPSSA